MLTFTHTHISRWVQFIFVGAFCALLIPFNLVEKYELSRYLKRLQEMADKSGSGRWEVQTEVRCEHDCLCYNSYRDLICRKTIFLMWYPVTEMVPGTQQASIPVATSLSSPHGHGPPMMTPNMQSTHPEMQMKPKFAR